jgi:hypothetical protein
MVAVLLCLCSLMVDVVLDQSNSSVLVAMDKNFNQFISNKTDPAATSSAGASLAWVLLQVESNQKKLHWVVPYMITVITS